MRKFALTKPKRIFAFGCSFTNYLWTMWPELLQYEFDCELHNFGRSGASNFFIAHTITQAARTHNFTKDDLILICWSSMYRQESYFDGDWMVTGSLENNPIFTDNSLVWKHDLEYWQMHNYSVMKSVDEFCLANNLNYNMFCIQDFTKHMGFYDKPMLDSSLSKHLVALYKPTLDRIAPSYHTVLYNNNLANKARYNIKQHRSFRDYHPLPLEHLDYLENVFNYTFSEHTKNTVSRVQQRIIEIWNDIVFRRGLKPFNVVNPHELYVPEINRIMLASRYDNQD